MKFALFVITFFVLRVALASPIQTYFCKSSDKTGQLRVIDTRITEPSVEFTPDIKGDLVFKSSFSQLGTSQISFLPQYVVIEDVQFKIVKKVLTDILIAPQVLHGGSPATLIVATRTMSVFSGKIKSLELKSYSCVLK